MLLLLVLVLLDQVSSVLENEIMLVLFILLWNILIEKQIKQIRLPED